MTLEYLINTYGYAAILIGTFFEGETVLVLGGATARLSYLELDWVILCAFTGTFFGDQLAFFLGRYKGREIVSRRPILKKHTERVLMLLERRRRLVILGFRFIYGTRTVTPFVLGMSGVPIGEFILLNIISAGVWAWLFGTLGYFFSTSLELLLGDIKNYEILVLVIVLVTGLGIWLIKLFRHH